MEGSATRVGGKGRGQRARTVKEENARFGICMHSNYMLYIRFQAPSCMCLCLVGARALCEGHAADTYNGRGLVEAW